jgi:hypothetical protein
MVRTETERTLHVPGRSATSLLKGGGGFQKLCGAAGRSRGKPRQASRFVKWERLEFAPAVFAVY